MEDSFGFFGDPTKTYLRMIHAAPPITPEEERALIEQIAQGNPDDLAKKRLMEANLLMAMDIARQYETPEWHLFDLTQQANMGLIESTKTIRPGNGPFSTYATELVHRALRDFTSRRERY